MYYYEVKSSITELTGKDSYVSSTTELSEFDLLVIDSLDYGFITCTISKKISRFDAISLPFEMSSYLMKMDIESYLKKKHADSKANTILKKAEEKAKEIQYIEKLRKYSKDPKVKVLLE